MIHRSPPFPAHPFIMIPLFRLTRNLMVVGLLLVVTRVDATDPQGKPALLNSYVKVSAALAADDFAGAKSAAANLMAAAKQAGERDLATKAGEVAAADRIAVARTNFKPLSAAIEPLAKGEKDYVVMTCPMVRADWVQEKGPTRNPYMGKRMLTCGGPKRTE